MFNRMFQFQKNDVRVILKNNQPWFVAKDVCDALGLSNPTRALSRLDDDELTLLIVRAGKQNREMNCVNESGLYSLILKSRKPEAKKFKRWVTSEVLPSIHKYGFYIGAKPSHEELKKFIERFFPKARYGQLSDKTGLHRLVIIPPHFRSCKIAKINKDYHPYLFNKNEIIVSTEEKIDQL